MINTSHLPLSIAALHKTPWYSRESDYIEFWGRKTSSGVYTPLCHADFILR